MSVAEGFPSNLTAHLLELLASRQTKCTSSVCTRPSLLNIESAVNCCGTQGSRPFTLVSTAIFSRHLETRLGLLYNSSTCPYTRSIHLEIPASLLSAQ